MGGRGSCLAYKHMTAGNDDNPIIVDWNDPETEFQNDMFKKLKELKISTRKSTDNIDDKIFERQQRQFYNIATKYKKCLTNTTLVYDMQLGSEKLEGNCLGYCASTIEEGEMRQRIVLDKKQFGDYDKIKVTVESGINNKWFVPINTMFNSRDYYLHMSWGMQWKMD